MQAKASFTLMLKEQFMALLAYLKDLIALDKEHPYEYIGPCCILSLGVIGIFFIHSAQSYIGGSLWKMQAVWLLIGAGSYFAISLLNYKFWLQNAHWLYWASVLLLLPLALQSALYRIGIPLQLPLVQTRWGATRWLDFGPASLQPSELAKLGVLLISASILVRSEFKTFPQQIKILSKIALLLSIPLSLIFLQPDLGSSLVFPPVILCLLYVSNLSGKILKILACAGVLLVLVVGTDIYAYQKFIKNNNLSALRDAGSYESRSWVPLRDYQRNRILTFLAPSLIDPRGTGVAWNLNQSLYTVAGGGLKGKGLNQGTQAKLGYLPSTVATNDFIFSVLAEESGFIGACVVIGLFAVLILNGIRVASLAKDRFGTLLAAGISTLLMVHIFINIGMTLGLMPITGLPLPFVSYGGSFMLICCVLQGITQSVYRFRRDFS